MLEPDYVSQSARHGALLPEGPFEWSAHARDPANGPPTGITCVSMRRVRLQEGLQLLTVDRLVFASLDGGAALGVCWVTGVWGMGLLAASADMLAAPKKWRRYGRGGARGAYAGSASNS